MACDFDHLGKAFGRLDLVTGQLEKRALVILYDETPKLFSPTFEQWVVSEVFDLVGTADHDFQEWLESQSKRFKPEIVEFLPRVNAKHRLWVGRWLSDDDAETFLYVVDCFLGQS
jgi:hypothetical protein